MSNTVPRPHLTDPDGTHDSRYLLVGDPRAIGPEGPEGPQGEPGERGPQGPPGERGDNAQAATILYWQTLLEQLPPASTQEVGTGALVGGTAPRTLYVVAESSHIGPGLHWVNVGEITIGPQGDTGPQGEVGPAGPPGPQPPLAGSGSAPTAARSDHNHDGIYSPATHTHSAEAITSGILSANRLPDLNTSQITAGTLSINRLPDIPVSKLTGTLGTAQIPTMDASKISTGTFAVDRLPNLPADKITSGTIPENRISGLSAGKIVSGTLSANRIPGLGAEKITSGTLNKGRIPRMLITELFPNNATTTTGSSAMRVGPGNAHAVLAILGAGWGVHDTGMRQNTDEMWAYVMVPGFGFCWVPANRI